MQKSSKTRIFILIIVIAILALLFGMWTHYNFGNKNKSQTLILNSTTLLPQPRPIQDFHLINDHNRPFTNNDFKNHWSFVFFGFTNCPQLCPTTLSVLNQMYKNLQQAHLQSMPQIVFISVDPDEDTPQKIRNYITSFNPNFVGATGSKQQLDALTKEFNVMYAKVFPNGEQSHYSIDHSGTILLINPAGQLAAIFSTPHDANNIAKDFIAINRQ